LDHHAHAQPFSRFAGFIVLNQNLFKIPVSKIHETTVDKTVFEGRPVYEAN
jgi:predicted amidohydrolase YtcJ